MIRGLRYLADKLSDLRCYIHIKWNAFLDKLKSKCICEKLPK